MTQGHTLINTIKRGREEGGKKDRGARKAQQSSCANRQLFLHEDRRVNDF